MTDKTNNARERIADAAGDIAEEENRQDQKSGESPATRRAEQIRETNGD